MVLQSFAAAVDEILASGRTLHAWAAQSSNARALQGRITAYATTLGGARVVVRHSHHGGLLAPVTKDFFFAPTRAPHELRISLRLRANRVSTPEVIAYATYAVIPGIERADVVTREISGQELMSTDGAEDLMIALSNAGAVHPDLNMHNVLVDGTHAYVLDVDRVYFLPPNDPRVMERNRARLLRSARKLGR